MKSNFRTLPVVDGRSGAWQVDTFTITPEKSQTLALRAACNGDFNEYIPPGKYRRLRYGREVVMSNTPMEVNTCATFIERATGEVLINGLGLGMVLNAILAKRCVRTVTVVEKSEDVINLVWPAYQHDSRAKLIHADALERLPSDGEFYDTCWHDIWSDLASSNLKQMHLLESRYKNHCDWQGSWGKTECEAIRYNNY